MKKVFIDGSAGTTGLRIRERLSTRPDLELIVLPEDLRKEVAARRDALNASDIAFLCLPDAAAIEAAALVENPATVVIDTSTAHRCNPSWTYGFAELSGLRSRIAKSKRVANPGCHASGFIALVAPLVEAGLLAPTATLGAFSLTGYSGGGKKMIAEYEEQLNLSSASSASGAQIFLGGRQYALGQAHKHLPEMVRYCGLTQAPVFSPVVVPHLSGMEVTVQLSRSQLGTGFAVRSDTASASSVLAQIQECYREYYRSAKLVRFVEQPGENGFISSAAECGKDSLTVSACGNDDRILLVALFDNLGKGASGAAIQNMNIALGLPEETGLVL